MVHWKTLLVAVVPVVGILVGELNHLGRTSFEHLPADLRPFRPYMIQTLNGLGKVGTLCLPWLSWLSWQTCL